MGNLIFLSYDRGPHVIETIFAILSAVHTGGVPDAQGRIDGCRVHIYTDDPEPFEIIKDAGVRIRPVDAAQIKQWIGPLGYQHRVKILVLADALRTLGEPCALIDGDTYFLKSPAGLFTKVGPGRAVMHVKEGPTAHMRGLGKLARQLRGQSFTTASGFNYTITDDAYMWNSGIVAMDPADAAMLETAAELNDCIYSQVPNRIAEQIAFTGVLSQRTELSAARDIIFHYHQKFLRDPFRLKEAALLESLRGLPLQEQARRAYAHRPVPPAFKRFKAKLKRTLKPWGMFRGDMETSI